MTDEHKYLSSRIGYAELPSRRRHWMATDQHTNMTLGNVSLWCTIRFCIGGLLRGHGWGKIERWPR